MSLIPRNIVSKIFYLGGETVAHFLHQLPERAVECCQDVLKIFEMLIIPL